MQLLDTKVSGRLQAAEQGLETQAVCREQATRPGLGTRDIGWQAGGSQLGSCPQWSSSQEPVWKELGRQMPLRQSASCVVPAVTGTTGTPGTGQAPAAGLAERFLGEQWWDMVRTEDGERARPAELARG